jgi:hypothetical protein
MRYHGSHGYLEAGDMNEIRTKEEAQRQTYGYRSTGVSRSYDPTKCVEAVSRHVGRWPTQHQCKRDPGFGPDGLYCKQHDPDARAAKRAAQSAKWEAEREAVNRLAAELDRLLDQLGHGHSDGQFIKLTAEDAMAILKDWS